MPAITRFSETIGALTRVEDLLQLLLDDATVLLAEPADAENDRWLAAVVDKMLANLRNQFRIEEQGGYVSVVLERHPARHPQIRHLEQEHRLLEQQLQEVADRMRSERRDSSLSQECRRQLADWIRWYREHRRRENALVQEAFVLEVGQGESSQTDRTRGGIAMFQTIELIEPYFVGSALLFWEAFIGWCLWESIRSDVSLHRERSVSDSRLDTPDRVLIRDDRPARSKAQYVPATSA